MLKKKKRVRDPGNTGRVLQGAENLADFSASLCAQFRSAQFQRIFALKVLKVQRNSADFLLNIQKNSRPGNRSVVYMIFGIFFTKQLN